VQNEKQKLILNKLGEILAIGEINEGKSLLDKSQEILKSINISIDSPISKNIIKTIFGRRNKEKKKLRKLKGWNTQKQVKEAEDISNKIEKSKWVEKSK
jgi:hypothetical protein